MAKRPLWRRIVRIVGIGLGVVVALLVLAVAALHTRWGKAWVRGRLEQRLAQRFVGGATLGSLDYGFLFSDVELGDLVIRDAAGRPAIRIASARAALDRSSILHGTPVIDALAIDGFALTIVQGADGRTNLAGLMVPSGKPSLASIEVRELTLTGGVTATGPDGSVITVRDLTLAGAVAARPPTHELEVTLGAVTATLQVDHPGAPRREVPLALATAVLGRHGDVTDVDVRGVEVGAVSVAKLGGRVEVTDGRFVGAQRVALEGIRVDHRKLATLLGRTLLVDDVRGDVTLAGPVGALVVHGDVAIRSTKLALDGTLDLTNRVQPRYHLTLVGTGRSDDVLALANPAAPEVMTSVKVQLDGSGVTLASADAALTLEIGATTVGALTLEGLVAKLHAKQGALTLDQLSAHGLGFEIGATGVLAADTSLHARLTATGDPSKAIAALAAAGISGPRRIPPLPEVTLVVDAAGALDGAIALTLQPVRLAIAGGTLHAAGGARFAQRKLVDATATVSLDALDLAQLARFVGRPATVHGRLAGSLDVRRTPTSVDARYDVVATLPQVEVHAQGHADRTHLTTTARLVHAGTELGRVVATVPLARGALARGRPWHVTVGLPRRTLAELGDLVPPALRARLAAVPDAAVELHADIAGTPAAPRGTIDAAVTGPRAHAELHATVAPGRGGSVVTTTGALGLDALAATLHGTVTLPRGDLRRGSVDETLELADAPIGSLPRVPPAVAELGGTVGGRVHVTGTLAAPVLDSKLGWQGYRTAAGGTGDTTLALAGTPQQLTATLDHGHGAVTVVADVARGTDRIDIHARAHADDTPLLPLLPALGAIAHGAPAGADLGRLRWDMRVDLGLARRTTGLALDRADVDGSLAVHGGSFAIPHSTRRWHAIDLELAGDPQGLRLTTLDIHERDRQLPDRRLHASGLLALDHLHPTRLQLALETQDWLLLGLTSPVFTDAPTAAVDVRARVDADLTTPVPAVDVTVDALSLDSPDRHLRAHQPERASVAGDVIFVDAATPAGRLPALAPAGPLPGGRPLDIRVHIPTPVHVNKDPLDIMITGELVATVRPERTIPRGEVTLHAGSINLFAQQHALVRGTITLSEQHPRGWLDLVFEHRLPDPAARDLAHPERGARLTLTGEPAAPQLAISGAANATLPEVFTMYNTGHALRTASPGLPATSTVRVPRGDQSNILAFVSLALPHLLFLDRIAAWADASEPRGGYGRIRNLEADRYTRGERTRVRAVGRPTSPGRSTAELQLDHLLLHDDRKALGIGLRAGDRLGGGVGLIFEWSSRP